MGLCRNLLSSLLGKQKVTPIELGEIIATKVLDDLGHPKSPFLGINPIFKRLHPAVQKGFVIEKTAAYLAFFSYHFLRSCHDQDFGLQTFRHYGGVILTRMCQAREFQEILGVRQPGRC